MGVEREIEIEMEMEMDITKLDCNALPKLEKRLLAHMQNDVFLAGYIYGFAAEEGINLRARAFLQELNQYSNIALLRAGSGGRLDGSGVGEQDLILLTTDITKVDCSDKVLDDKSISDLIKKLESDIDFDIQLNTDCIVEQKKINGDPRSLIYYKNNQKPFPGRVLEAVFIAGNPSLFKDAKLKVLSVIYGNNKILKRIKEELKTYKKVTLSGETSFKNKITPQFLAEKKLVLYNPNEKIHGFKYGPLRYMQLALAIEFYSLLVNKKVYPEFLVDLPASLEDRARYIFRKNLCSPKYEDYLTSLVIAYMKTVNIQSKLKLDYHSKSRDQTGFTYETVSEGTIPNLQKIVEKHPLGEITVINKN